MNADTLATGSHHTRGEPWEATERLDRELAALNEKLDRLTATAELLDRRRDEMEELVEDLMPAVNGMMLQLRDRLDHMDRSGAFANGIGALEAAETALAGLDPQDLEALALAVPALLRAARTLATPQITGLVTDFASELQEAHHGPPPTLRQLLRTARAPRVRRGMQVALGMLRALGAGNGAAPAPVRAAPPVRRVTPSPERAPIRAPAARGAVRPPAPVGALQVGDRSLALDADGGLADPGQWDREVAQVLAAQAGVTLTDAHWSVLDFVRKEGEDSGAAPGIRRIVAETGISQKELYGLFPGGPAILAARLAGLEKPKSCV